MSLSLGKIEQGRVLPYNFSITENLKEAWARVKGSKGTYWCAVAWEVLSIIAVGCIGILLGSLIPNETFENAVTQIGQFILYPLTIGFFYIAVRRSVDLAIKSTQVFYGYRYIWRLLGLLLISLLLIGLVSLPAIIIFAFFQGLLSALQSYFTGFIVTLFTVILGCLAFLLFTYILFALTFAPVLMIEKNIGIFSSIKLSILGFKQHYFKIILLLFSTLVIIMISALPLFIGLIWTIPMAYNSVGILYRTIYGVEKASLDRL